MPGKIGGQGFDIFDPKNAEHNMRIGGMICLIGIVITVASCAVASESGGFVLAYGAILVGAFQFFGGLLQWLRLKETEKTTDGADSKSQGGYDLGRDPGGRTGRGSGLWKILVVVWVVLVVGVIVLQLTRN